MSLSARHLVPVASNITAAAVSTYAQDVRPGNVVTTMVNGEPSGGTVMATRRSMAQGVFNAYTKVIVQTLACTASRGVIPAVIRRCMTIGRCLAASVLLFHTVCTHMILHMLVLQRGACNLSCLRPLTPGMHVRRVATSLWTVCWRPATATGYWTTQCRAGHRTSPTCFPLHTRCLIFGNSPKSMVNITCCCWHPCMSMCKGCQSCHIVQ